MKLLVTGGAGFIGSNFIRYWLKKYPKDYIINLDTLTYAGNLSNLVDISGSPQYKFIKGNICDVKLVGRIMEGIDTVVNFAAESHVDRSITSPALFIKTNIIGTEVLLSKSKECHVKRFHHISTDEVYGDLELSDKRKFSENSPYKPNSPYAASKASADHLVNAYYVTYGLPVTITNCSNNYGPFQHPEKLIPLSITNLLEGQKVPVYGDGLYIRDWLYVEDHCRAIDKVLKNGTVGDTYCVGGLTAGICNLDIVRKILKLLGKDERSIVFVKDRPGHDRKYAVDWSKIKKNLDWQPEHDFDSWLVKTVDWYKKNTAWWQKLKSAKFKKYYQKQYNDL